MSHTDRHRPYWVQLVDPEERNFYYFQRWPWSAPEKVLIHRICSCRWHSMYYPRKAEHCTRRRMEREATIEILKGNPDAFERL